MSSSFGFSDSLPSPRHHHPYFFLILFSLSLYPPFFRTMFPLFHFSNHSCRETCDHTSLILFSHSSLSFMFFDFFHFLNFTHSCLLPRPFLSFISFIRCHQLSQSFQLMPGNRNEEGKKLLLNISFRASFSSLLFHFLILSHFIFFISSFLLLLSFLSSFSSLILLPSPFHHHPYPIHSKTSANYNCVVLVS